MNEKQRRVRELTLQIDQLTVDVQKLKKHTGGDGSQKCDSHDGPKVRLGWPNADIEI